jgi:hypothetical protein
MLKKKCTLHQDEKIVIFISGLSNTEWVASFITAATLLPVLVIFHAAYTQH